MKNSASTRSGKKLGYHSLAGVMVAQLVERLYNDLLRECNSADVGLIFSRGVGKKS